MDQSVIIIKKALWEIAKSELFAIRHTMENEEYDLFLRYLTEFIKKIDEVIDENAMG